MKAIHISISSGWIKRYIESPASWPETISIILQSLNYATFLNWLVWLERTSKRKNAKRQRDHCLNIEMWLHNRPTKFLWISYHHKYPRHVALNVDFHFYFSFSMLKGERNDFHLLCVQVDFHFNIIKSVCYTIYDRVVKSGPRESREKKQ